jgi:hypothetical protein
MTALARQQQQQQHKSLIMPWRRGQLHQDPSSNTARGRCYDHNFRRFLPIFGEKFGAFLKNQCYDQNFV